jgi:hypothetical protein
MLSVCTLTGWFRRALTAFGLIAALIFAAGPAVARDLDSSPVPHLRTESKEMRALVDETAQRSPTFRTLVDRLDHTDVIVYVRNQLFTRTMLDGRIGLLSAQGGHRFLIIEISCTRPRIVQMTTLGHELSHALEIASAPSIVDTTSLARHYARIGMEISDGSGQRTFETLEASETGARVRRELLTTFANRTD